MPLKPGEPLLNGQYHILSLIGRGGYGSVYHARDTHLGEDVAIKELLPGLIGDDQVRKRFLAEAKATLHLRHDRIVGTHLLFPEREADYLVMDYMPGGSLEDRLRQGPLSIEESVRIAAEVCEALAYAHGHGVVHCDLKPANILFTAQGSAKLADFGIAYISDQALSRSWQTAAGFVAGTLPYMAPEQVDGVRDDPRLDLYALGAVLYRMLTGRPYLDFDTSETPRAQMENLQRICDPRPVPPGARRPDVPPWLDRLVLKALAKRPADRFPTAEALRAALRNPDRAPVPLQLLRTALPEPPTMLHAKSTPLPGLAQQSPLPLTTGQERYKAFFTALLAKVQAAYPGLTGATKAYPDNWFSFPVGRKGFTISVILTIHMQCGVSLEIVTADRAKNKSAFDSLLRERAAIEAAIGEPLHWERMDESKGSRIAVRIPGSIDDDPAHLEELQNWAVVMIGRFRAAFEPYLHHLKS